MKNFLIAFLILAAICRVPEVHAQADQRTLSTKIADLLARMPSENQTVLQSNMDAVSSMGVQGIEAMALMLKPLGQADNTPLQYALGSYSYYTTKTGNKQLRELCAEAYCNALNKIADKENKAFIIRQLQIVGGDASVKCLQPYLLDDRLCDPAARSLVMINTPASKKAILDALQNASEATRITLVQALGDSHYKEAAPAIQALATGSDAQLTKAALYALGEIGDPASQSTLAEAASKSGFTFEPTDAVGAYLVYIHQLNENGNGPLAEKAALQLQKNANTETQVHTRTAALKLLTEIKGEKSLPLLISAIKDNNASYRIAALKYATAFKDEGSVSQWVKAMKKASPEAKSEIITMLGNSKAKTALAAVLKALKDKNLGVRLAAITAAGQIGNQDALAAILDNMKSGDTNEVNAAQSAILSMSGPGITDMIGDRLSSMDGDAKVALIEVLAARAAENRVSDILPLVSSNDAQVRKAAFVSLKNVVSKNNLSSLYTLLNQSTDSAEISEVQSAIIAASASIGDTAQRAEEVIAQMKQAPAEKQYLFYNVLAGIGGKDALRIVSEGYKAGSAQARQAIVKALSTWPDASAAEPLYQIALQSNAGNSNEALNGYIKAVSKSNYPDDQRLLMLRKAMDISKTPAQQKQILSEIGKCHTFIALMYAGKYLDNIDLKQTAAHVVMNIALSNTDWNGDLVRNLLEKTITILKGGDADYQKEAIRKYISEMPSSPAFVALFNGKDLTGWKGLVANPILRAKMDARTLAKEQQKADSIMRKGWYVKDGLLIFTGEGQNLCTERKYGDVEMYVDWMIHKDGDAGIYLRGTPQVQIWDTSRVDAGAQVGSGGLYNNTTHPSKPLKLADNAIGDWNTFHIIMKGDTVTVYLNGELVVDHTILENYWDRKIPLFSKEQIELQAHGNLVAYRDLYLRELPRMEPFTLSEEEKKENFKVLFDGTNLDEWTGNKTDYTVENGNIAVYPKNGGHGNLYTTDEFSDFVFRFEFKLTPGANNGLGIRAPLEGDAAYEGIELQILDNTADIYKDLHPYQYHGSIYGTVAAKRGYLKPVGEWNYEEVIVKGPKIKVVLNGTTITDADITEFRKNGTPDKRSHPGLKRDKGHIGFLGHGDTLFFRNIRVKDLSQAGGK